MAATALTGWRLAAFGITLVVAAGGCGTGDDGTEDRGERRVAAALTELQRAFDDGAVDRICKRTTRVAQRQAGTAAHGAPTTCGRDVRRLLRMISTGGGWVAAHRPRVADVEIDGTRATATVVLADGGRVNVPFERDGEAWKLNSFFGTPPDEIRPTRGTPPARGAVEVADREGACPDLYDAYPAVAGGCELRLSGRRVALTVGTLFGRFRFATCWVAFRVAVDGTGRTWTDEVVVEGDPDTGCGDVEPCESKSSGAPLPWPGRIYARNGGAGLRARTCFETCVGSFEGDLETRLVPRGRGWRAVFDEAGAGRSGLAFDGPLGVGGAVRVRAARV